MRGREVEQKRGLEEGKERVQGEKVGGFQERVTSMSSYLHPLPFPSLSPMST